MQGHSDFMMWTMTASSHAMVRFFVVVVVVDTLSLLYSIQTVITIIIFVYIFIIYILYFLHITEMYNIVDAIYQMVVSEILYLRI